MTDERPTNRPTSRRGAPAVNREALFESLLIAYDEALARGEDLPPDESRVPPELRPRLRAAIECLARLAKPRPTMAPGLAKSSSPPTEPTPFPGRVGRFHLLREVGRGGHGVVFLAVDPRLNRLVALKVPRPEVLVTPDLHRRFLREARAASALAHPNLVPIHEAGDDGPFCYIAAAYCEGPTLATWLKGQTSFLPFQQAAALIAVLADAVAHAHDRGILHRDIKPANVLIAAAYDARSPGLVNLFDVAVVPRLTDFGLAKLIDEEASARTHTGTTLGTPAYMASEQADGRTEDIGPAVDIYALGVILYELLVGRPPFRGANDLETLRLVSAAEVVVPSRLRPSTPRDLEAICLRALERKPSQRYATAAGMADDLRRFIGGRPTLARPLGKLRQTARWFVRRPLRAVLAGVCLLAMMVVAGGGWWHSAELSKALEIARKARLHSEVLRNAADTRAAWQAFNSHHAAHAQSLLRSAADGPVEEDQRSFAWHLLWQRLHDERLTLTGHESAVYAVAYSPDGRQLASAGQDRSVRIWDCTTGACLAVLTGHANEVNMVVWSPEGRWLASAGDDGVVRLWDAVRRRPLDVMLGESHGPAVSLSFSPDGSLLAAGYDDGALLLIDTADWQTKRLKLEATNRIEMLAFSPDGARLTAAAGRSGVKVWNIAEEREEPLRSLHRLRAFDVAFDHAGHLAACGDEWAALWDLPADQVLMQMSLPSEHVQSLTFCLDDRYIALARRDAAVQLHQVPSAARGHALLGHTDRVWCVVPSPDGQSLATASADKTIKIWGLTGSMSEAVYEFPDRVEAIAFAPAGQSLLVGSEKGELTRWEVRRPESPIPSPTGPEAVGLANRRSLAKKGESAGAIQSVAVSPDGRLAATCRNGEAGARLWNLASQTAAGEPLVANETSEHPYTGAVAFSTDGELLAHASNDAVYLWYVASRRVQTVLRDHVAVVRALAFSPDGQRLAVAAGDEIAVWDPRAARRLKVWRAHGAQLATLAYSVDGRRLASGSDDRLAKLWDTETGAEEVAFSGHTEAVRNVAFSPDGLLLATASDATVRLWSLATHDELAAIDDFSGTIRTLAFSSREMVLAVGGARPDGGGELRLWRAPPSTKWLTPLPATPESE